MNTIYDRIGDNKEKNLVISSLGWRLATVSIVALTATAFVIAWVINTRTLASKDIQIEEIRSRTAKYSEENK